MSLYLNSKELTIRREINNLTKACICHEPCIPFSEPAMDLLIKNYHEWSTPFLKYMVTLSYYQSQKLDQTIIPKAILEKYVNSNLTFEDLEFFNAFLSFTKFEFSPHWFIGQMKIKFLYVEAISIFLCLKQNKNNRRKVAKDLNFCYSSFARMVKNHEARFKLLNEWTKIIELPSL